MVAQARRGLLLQLDEGAAVDPAGQRAALGRLVREETERLQRRKADHERREAADRAELVDRLAVDTTAEGERMRRYQLDFDRKLHRALNTLLKLRRGEGVGVVGDPAPDDAPEPETVGTVELQSGPVDGPEGGADAEVPQRTENRGLEDDDSVAVGVPSSFGLDPSSILELELLTPAVAAAAAEPAQAGIAAPARPAAEPEGHPTPQDELSPAVVRCPSSVVRCWGGEATSQNEPGPPADAEPISRNEPGPPADGDRIPRNEPSSPGDGAAILQNEPTAPRRVAAPAVPVLVFALVILLAALLSAAFAGARRARRPGGSSPGGAIQPSRRKVPSTFDGHYGTPHHEARPT